jgi:hypothetical protein
MQNQTGHPMIVGSNSPALVFLNKILSSSFINKIYYY